MNKESGFSVTMTAALLVVVVVVVVAVEVLVPSGQNGHVQC